MGLRGGGRGSAAARFSLRSWRNCTSASSLAGSYVTSKALFARLASSDSKDIKAHSLSEFCFSPHHPLLQCLMVNGPPPHNSVPPTIFFIVSPSSAIFHYTAKLTNTERASNSKRPSAHESNPLKYLLLLCPSDVICIYIEGT